jgi:hypothetical protein
MSNAIKKPADDPIERLLDFIFERESIRIKREAGERRPWTACPILRDYRFTNIRREHDRGTVWLHQKWLKPHKDDHDLWFAVVVAQLIGARSEQVMRWFILAVALLLDPSAVLLLLAATARRLEPPSLSGRGGRR